jgi:glycosyltransferase involved in cell wall biosynthesis
LNFKTKEKTGVPSSLRIGFNARLLHAPTVRGWNRYTVNLIRELLTLGVEAVLFSDQPIHESHLARFSEGTFEVRASPPMNYFQWEQIWLAQECARAKVAILHSPFHFGLPFWGPCPNVLTLHDGIDQVFYRNGVSPVKALRLNSLKMDFLQWIARTKAHSIITVSDHACEDLVRHLRIPREKIWVIPEAADPIFERPIGAADRARVRARYGLQFPYIFYVGGFERRKNIPFLLKAFARAGVDDVHLVLAGGNAAQAAALTSMSQKPGIAPRVHALGWVPEEDLPVLYAEALCFVYPSKYEGFGLQLCEAMSAGCAVLAARSASLPEVLGCGGETFGLESTSELELLLQMVARDAGRRAALQLRAKDRIREFSWRTAARKTMVVYQEAMRLQ